MHFRNVSILAASALLLLGCKKSGDDPLPPGANPPAVNQPPIANAGPDQRVLTGAAVSLSGSGTDANGSIVSYAWTQTSGAAVTLSGSATPTPTFLAPAAPSTLQFLLTVTDEQGATSTDTMTVSVDALAAPVIVRQPTNIVAFENGMALMFVVASGENLNYEWHYSSGALWNSGPEPYMTRGGHVGGLPMSDDGRCFYVIISNDAGSATSEPGCMKVIETGGISDPSDPVNNNNANAAQSYGNAIMEMLRLAAGAKTGPVYPGRSGVPSMLGPGDACHGATLDGLAITQPVNLPLGHHTITEVWNGCHNGDPDEPRVQNGGLMISYDFPDEFGVGTYTIYLSGHGEYAEYGFPKVMNGIMTVTSERSTSATGVTQDDFEVTLDDWFSPAGFRMGATSGFDSLELHRTYDEDGQFMTDARVDWRLGLDIFDDNGYVGTVIKTGGSDDIRLHYNPGDEDDEGVEPWTAEGSVVVSIVGTVGTYYGARLSMAHSDEWHFFIDELPDPDDP